LAVGLTAGVTVSFAEAAIRIVEPVGEEILYGETRILVRIDPGADVERIVFYLDEFPDPVCRTAQSVNDCFFDAGPSLQGRTIRVRAVGPAGRTLGEDVVETLGSPRPERVVRRTLKVPIVATAPGDDPPDVMLDELTCWFATRECRPVSLTKLTEVERLPVSLEMLVDVSGSVDVHREELLEALEYVIDSAPVGVEIATTEFAGTYSRLVPFTTDKEVLRQGLLRLGSGGFRTCLVGAMRRSLFALQALPGHRILFVISDGEENCLRNAKDGLDYMDTLYDVVSIAREISAPIYLYRFEEKVDIYVRRSLFAKSYEGVAGETGGRLFAHDSITSLPSALRDLVGDLENTWLLDLDLPVVLRPDWKRRLVLELPRERGIRLRYPEYWEAENREDALRAMLSDGDERARLWAATRLRANRNPDVMGDLLRALRRETVEEVRLEQIVSIQEVAGGLLLHGDREAQKAAVKAVETLHSLDTALLAPLGPALRVYAKMSPPPKLLERLGKCFDFPPPQRAGS
jgi:hypothetical protein